MIEIVMKDYRPEKPQELGRLRVDGKGVHIEGNMHTTEINVLDLETGESVSFQDDPERWARFLPYHFRAGDIMVEIVHDDDPFAG